MKTLLIIFAVFVAVFGLGFFLVPAQVISIYGGDIQDEFAWRYFGASLLGIAVVNFFARNAPRDSEALRGVLYGDVVGSAASLVVGILVQLSETPLPSVWFNVAVNGIFMLAFGYFAFVKRPGAA